jgi:hypothetical protein
VKWDAMKFETRRREIGKMLVDVVKYILTIVLIGSLLTDKLTLKMAMLGSIMAIVILIIAFFTLPADKNNFNEE